MKFLALIGLASRQALALVGVCLLTASLAACGGDASKAGTATDKTIVDSAKPPKVRLPPGPPPTHLVVKDLRRGAGAAIPAGATLGIRTNYVALSYATGKPYEVRWSPTGAFNIGFNPGGEIKGWEKGLPGMRVGGRRELRVPSRLAYGNGALFYVIDLLGIER